MTKARKILGISMAILGVSFMYIATAFAIEWIVGIILLILGYILYQMSPNEVALKPKKP